MQNKLELINPPELGKHSGYSHGVKVQSGSLVFIAGQIGLDETGKFSSSEFVGQFDQTLANVLAVVRQGGGVPENIARLTIYVLDRQEFLANLKPLGEIYQRRMGKHFPAITLVEVKGLYEEGAKVEIEGTAAL